MVNLDLAADEGIIIEEEGLVWVVNEEEDLDALVLTNKNLYLVYTKMNGIFSKSTTEIITHPFVDIKVINGAPLIDVVDDNDYGLSLQIQFIEGRQLFICSEDENTIKWYQTLYKTVTGQDAPNEYQVPTKATKGIGAAFASGLGGLTANIANATATASQSLAAKVQVATTQVAASFESTKAQIQEQKVAQQQNQQLYQQTYTAQPSSSFCPNCGGQTSPGAKFCQSCGNPISSTNEDSQNPPPIPTAAPSNSDVRRQEFAGTILKCPNCGAVISQTTAICPECGHHITGQAAVSSVQAFSNQLMMLESQRKGMGFGQFMGMTADPVDEKKLTLIQSFPIPNTIDDIQEFMLLAVANIDVALSKNSFTNNSQRKMKSGMNKNITMPRSISDAWVAKMQQTYQKALALFPNEPAFSYIKQLYVDKMDELKMKIK